MKPGLITPQTSKVLYPRKKSSQLIYIYIPNTAAAGDASLQNVFLLDKK